MNPTQTEPKRKIPKRVSQFWQRHTQENIKDPNAIVKKVIWLYFLLLIFEGALRKWVIPPLANPLLLVRDPVALWIIILAYRRGLIVYSKYLVGMLFLGIAAFFIAIIIGHGNFMVALYGTRILVIHFPLIFIIGRVFTKEDVIKIGKFTILITGPMALLIALQFYSPQSAWVNRGVGGNLEGAGFSGALGFFRPPATFSFTNGTSMFFGYVAPFVFYFWLNPKGINKIILIAATVGLLISIPLSISRTLFFQIAVCMVFTVIAISRKPEYIGKMIAVCVIAVIALLILSKTSFFQTATEAFTDRFEGANESEGGVKGVLGNRYLGGMINSVTGSSQLPFFGYGIGMGTSVGGMLLSGEQTLLISAEDEWARLTGEMGALMGLGVIMIRLGLCFQLVMAAYRKLILGDLLSWLLLSICLLNVPQGQWGQPTALGFSVVLGGLTMAALKNPRKIKVPPKSRKMIPANISIS